jgi:hypothetical protein
MKVLNLRCTNGHCFEGWFGSEADFLDQNGRSAIACPLCADHVISRMPSAPRLNLSSSRSASLGGKEDDNPGAPGAPKAPAAPAPNLPPQMADVQAVWLQAVRHLMANTDDVGPRFAEEARRIHYGEAQQRGIRGQASKEERLALLDEGIETLAVPIPESLKGPLQ